MIYKIDSSTTQSLLHLPETGMGYQIIKGSAVFKENNYKYLVLNAELAINMGSSMKESIKTIYNEGYGNILNTVDPIVFGHFEIERNSSLVFGPHIPAIIFQKHRRYGGRSAIENQVEEYGGGDKYVRLSAYEDDLRIDKIRKCLLPGSFATNLHDYIKCVFSKDDPVDRYSLPNDIIISNAFFITPKTGELLQQGIVQPAFMHIGGGMEVYFESGTTENSYHGLSVYGEINKIGKFFT